MTTLQAFRPDVRGTFVDRPNRFVVRVDLGGTVVEAHCPNPGRITELLFPGSTVLLERAPGLRKLTYTLVAVERTERDGRVATIPLASVRANEAVGALVLPLLFPGYQTARPEFTLEGSRFDWLVVGADGVRHLVEVKACSEVEHGSALFPDAPSPRARKHLEELAEWGGRGYVPHVVFAVVHGRPAWFGANAHTDPEFARTLAALAPQLNLHAVVFESDADGHTRVVDPDLPVRTAEPGPDSGHLVRVEGTEGNWSVVVEWYPSGFEKAGAKAPARRSFAIRGGANRRAALEAGLRAGPWTHNPLHDRAWVDWVMELRHQPADQ